MMNIDDMTNAELRERAKLLANVKQLTTTLDHTDMMSEDDLAEYKADLQETVAAIKWMSDNDAPSLSNLEETRDAAQEALAAIKELADAEA